MTELQSIGIELLVWLQQFHPQLDNVAAFLALFVKPEVFLVFVIPVLYYNINQRVFFLIYIALLFDTALGEALRVLLAQPRPWWIMSELVPLDRVTSIYSSPSGYASFSIVFWGLLVLAYRKPWLLVLAVAFTVATNTAKMYEAAAMPVHLLTGYLQGAVVLYLVHSYQNVIYRLLEQLSNAIFYKALLALSALILMINLGCFAVHETYVLPDSWTQFRVLPSIRLSNGGMILALGLFIGATIARRKLICSYPNILTQCARWYRLVASALGIAGFVVVFVLLRQSLGNVVTNRLLIAVVNLSSGVISSYWLYFGVVKLTAQWGKSKISTGGGV